ncbi:hypothetical protein M422DRAFT_97814, partial [Sphaerobolus stellatus SS14]
QTRDTSTCGDPCEAIPYVNYFFPAWTDSFLVTTADFTFTALLSEDVRYMGVRAYMFPTQQPGTVPLYGFSQNDVDRMFVLALADGSEPPSPTGYQPGTSPLTGNNIAGYFYPTQVCGSVPLYQLFSSQITDHFYTTDEQERQLLISENLYADLGIIAYVLP